MVVAQGEFAVPVAPSTATASQLTNPHLSTTAERARQGSPLNAEASSSKRRLDMADASYKRSHSKKVERRVLPARIASSNTNLASNNTSTSRELNDMVMECFAKAFLETYQPSEIIPVMITTEPISTLGDSLIASGMSEPQWWNGEFCSFRRSTEVKQKPASQSAQRPSEPANLSPSPEKQRASLSIRIKPSLGAPLSDSSPVSNSPRGLRARGVVQYTDTAILKHEPMDTSDEFYARLHRKHEMGERKEKLRETDKMVQARNKLKARIEVLELAEDHVWLAHIEKLLKKAARYAGDENDARSGTEEHDSDPDGRDPGMNARRGELTEDELAEKVQRLVLLAGMKLVKRKSPEQLKEELIAEGKDLLEKYDRTLGIRGGRNTAKAEQGARNVHSDGEDTGKSRTDRMARYLSNDMEKSETPELDLHKPEYKHFKRKRTVVSPHSDDESRSTSVGLEPLPLDAAARSDGESVYEEAHGERPKKKQVERKHQSRRTGYAADRKPSSVALRPVEPLRERIYPPLTASGLPVLIEAADRRLKILEAEAEKKRLEEEAKSKRKRVPEIRSKSSRVLAAPFGMPMPDMVGFHNEYDLDGDFWIPYLKARLEGGFNLNSLNVQHYVDNTQGTIITQQSSVPGQTSVLAGDTGEALLNVDTSQPQIDLSATNNLPENPLISQRPVLPTPPPRFSTEPASEALAQNQEMDISEDSPLRDVLNGNEHPASDVVPDSQPADSDIVPSSWRTEDAVANSGG